MKAATVQTIMNRLTPCGCGCKGRDPWHRASFRRVVTDLCSCAPFGAALARTKTQPSMGLQPIAEMGHAHVPGYPRAVRVVRVVVCGRPMPYWEIDDDSAVAARNGLPDPELTLRTQDAVQ